MKKAIVLSVGLFLSLSSVVYAANEEKTILQRIAEKSRWELGDEISYIQYKEPGVMRETGMMYGINGSFGYHNNFMLKAEGSTTWGQVNYRNSGALDDIDNFMLEVRALGGYDFLLKEKYTLTPYFGFGYRYLNDDTGGMVSTTGAAGYERESNYYYSPVGVEAMVNLKNSWSLGASVEYDIFWLGKQLSHLEDVNPGYNTLNNKQDEGFGVRGSLKVQKKTEKFNLFVEPFIRYWNIRRSDDDNITYSGSIFGYGYEPKNNSTEIGCKLGLIF